MRALFSSLESEERSKLKFRIRPTPHALMRAQGQLEHVCAANDLEVPLLQLTDRTRWVAADHATGAVQVNPRFVDSVDDVDAGFWLACAVVELRRGRTPWWHRVCNVARWPLLWAAVGATFLSAVPKLVDQPGAPMFPAVVLWAGVLATVGVWCVVEEQREVEVADQARVLSRHSRGVDEGV